MKKNLELNFGFDAIRETIESYSLIKDGEHYKIIDKSNNKEYDKDSVVANKLKFAIAWLNANGIKDINLSQEEKIKVFGVGANYAYNEIFDYIHNKWKNEQKVDAIDLANSMQYRKNKQIVINLFSNKNSAKATSFWFKNAMQIDEKYENNSIESFDLKTMDCSLKGIEKAYKTYKSKRDTNKEADYTNQEKFARKWVEAISYAKRGTINENNMDEDEKLAFENSKINEVFFMIRKIMKEQLKDSDKINTKEMHDKINKSIANPYALKIAEAIGINNKNDDNSLETTTKWFKSDVENDKKQELIDRIKDEREIL